MKTILAALAAALFAVPAYAADTASTGTITIPVTEYEALKKAVDGDEKDAYWDMTFQQILDHEDGDADKAWKLYDYWVLRRVYLDGEVSGSSVDDLIGDFHVLGEVSAKPVTLVISSPGGSVFAGMRLYNAMMASAAPINTECDGMAASMAAVILAAGAHRTASPACVFLIHEMSGGAGGGNTTHMIKAADWYISVESVLWTILSENSGISVKKLRALAEYESFYTAAETLTLGFVDEVSGAKPRELAAGSRGVPDNLLPSRRIPRHIAERLAE